MPFMRDVLCEDFRFLPLTRGASDQDKHVGMLLQNLLDEGDVFFRYPAPLREQSTRIWVDQYKGVLARMIAWIILPNERRHAVLFRDRIMDSL